MAVSLQQRILSFKTLLKHRVQRSAKHLNTLPIRTFE
jgi:hypothetical protein